MGMQYVPFHLTSVCMSFAFYSLGLTIIFLFLLIMLLKGIYTFIIYLINQIFGTRMQYWSMRIFFICFLIALFLSDFFCIFCLTD
jgi:hypothetical protein